ncbi:L-amino acid N-acyltransferase YncA [Loktanella sp. DSM 29012]|uniref:GNAT family N-acetyltransferase n=1 Tax=Loktanella sp. DSM 29012 TaxID=1881056 RepID=UPI0008AEBA95|nr:GNAT family N-acetyltransferase [Loktanella sp. DSM 29012]SEP61531.1 L-amino acid N-acyltransferase YncA [Loktanella sp. DSM 29012]
MMIRQATSADALGMLDVLNPIIAEGGTTAHQTSFDVDRMRQHYISRPALICTHVADMGGKIGGFQMLARPDPDDAAMQGWAIIASFVSGDHAGKGIGRALFAATRARALSEGFATIDATIRADNDSGLRYYAAMGFVDFDRLIDVPLRDGTRVDRIRKRFDL